ncbi:hypothetical protein FRACYDRAFT_254204 [Fragilariopsis cylindrus CCMP1102]|uniref:Uncharacterized protein n=1 Tax=Fragilariopsis cylindrus CCMP1102 TaxID=635003 RepID=A0A1E7EL59_9STRA|nr:hypothetical protein FRACYDRAFT_254204 [Fragilariopsis cylindrus CCMP1102]|eukprot:OEU06651.1 hypothetical protein FRACYDRAFT_254204 [Fragilariopsis cylindrus CCMP1102]
MTVQQQQSKQEQPNPANKTTTTTTQSTSTSKSISKSISRSVINDHHSSATRAANDNRAKIIPDNNNSNGNIESNRRPVDNFLTWLTSPLEIDVTGQTNSNNKTNDNTITANIKQSQQTKMHSQPSVKQQSSLKQKQPHQKKVQPQTSSPKNNNATKTVKHLPVEKQQQITKKVQTYHEQKMMQQNNRDNKQQHNKDGTNNNDDDDENPAERFLNWLTSPPDLCRDPLSNMTAHPNKKKKHVSPSNVNKPPQQQKQRSKQSHQSPTNDHKNQTKQFGEKIVFSKPDVSRSKSILHEINLDPHHPQLPSHVPTPDTIDDVDEPWTSKVEGVIDNALGGIHHHFSNIFSDNNQGKNNNIIKYAPSFDTPSQSPVSLGKKTLKSKLLLTPPISSSTKTTKWGPEIWNAKMSSPTNSLTMMSTPTMSTTSLMSTVTTAKNNSSSTSSVNSIVADGELLDIQSSEYMLLDLEFSELANQEKLLRQAMERKQKREQNQNQNKATKKITATTATNNDGSSGDGSPSSSRHNKSSPRSGDLNKKKKIKKEQPRASISSSSEKKNTNETSNATQNKKTTSSAARSLPKSVTTPLQLRWMYENALNLQASCPRRGSIRRCDGEDLNSYSSSLYTPILTVDEREMVCSSVMKEQQKHHPQQQQQQRINNVVIPKMSTPALESLDAIAAQ